MPLSQPAKIPGFTVGATMPQNPSIGDIWVERDSVDGLKMEWFWDGLRWRSVQILNWQGNFENISGLTHIRMSPVYFGLYNLFFLNLSQSSLQSSPSPSNFWVYSFSALNGSGTSTTLATTNNSGATTLITKKSTQINTFLNFQTQDIAQLLLSASKNGNPLNLSAGIQISYQLV